MENNERFGATIHSRMREESMCGKYLRLDKSEVNVGEDVLVTWNLPDFLTNYEDWIGMYEKDEDHVERHLQAKERCQNFSQYGSIWWKIDEALFTRCYTDVVFYYFSLYRNEIIGSSTKLTVINVSMPLMDDTPLADVDPNNLLSITITALSAANLRCKAVGSNPDPYVKLTVNPGLGLTELPHHKQLRVLPNCNGSIHPHWDDLDIGLVVLPTDILEINIRDRFNVRNFRFSHFLGRAKVPLNQFVRSTTTHTLTFCLGSRQSSDHVQGSVTVTITNNGLSNSSAVDHGDFVPPHDLVEGASFEDSVMISAERSDSVACDLPAEEPVIDPSAVAVPGTVKDKESDETSLPQTMIVPLSQNEEITAVMSTTNKEKTEGPPTDNEGRVTSPSFASGETLEGDKETIMSPPLTGGETNASPPPTSDEVFVSPPSGDEETVTSVLPLTSGEMTTSPPPSSGETLQAPSNATKPPSSTSHYQRLWSWDDSTTAVTTPSVAPLRRAVTCRHRPPPRSQQQQNQFDVSVLRRGGSTHHSMSFCRHNQDGPLPPNWDLKTDSVGRHVYINHVSRSVTLYHPSAQDSITSYDRQSSITEELGRYNERINYQNSSTLELCGEGNEEDHNVNQYMTLSSTASVNDSSFDQTVHHTVNQSTKDVIENDQRHNQGDQGVTAVDHVTPSDIPDVAKRKVEREPSVTSKDASSPAFLFITWNDVYAYMRSEKVKAIGDDFFSDPLVVKLFQYIRADHSIFKKYQHHPKLVAALNKFAMTDCELPDKWEKRLDKNGRAIFINHSNRSTSFVDPRLPYPGSNLKTSSTLKNWRAAARDKLEGLGTINVSTTAAPTTTTTITTARTAATMDRPRLFHLRNTGGSSDSDSDSEMERPRSHSLPSTSRNSRSIDRHRHLARRNRNHPQFAVLSDRPIDIVVPVLLRESPQVEEVVGTEEEVYQRRVVEFLRQDDIIDVIASRYDGPITDELRTTITEIAEEGPSKLRSLDDDSEITFQLGLILSLFEDAIVRRARLPATRDTRPSANLSSSNTWYPPTPQHHPTTPPPRPPTPPPHPLVSSLPRQPLSSDLLESTTMTLYGFTEGALNRFFSQDDVNTMVRAAGYVSCTVNDMIQAIQASGVTSVLEQGNYERNRILKYVIDAVQMKIEEYSGETRNADMSGDFSVPVEVLTDAQIFAFIMQPSLLDVLGQRYNPVSSLMKIVVLEIQAEGEPAVKRLRTVDSNLQKLIRDFFSEIKSYSRDVTPAEQTAVSAVPTQQRKNVFAIKLHAFQSKLSHAGYRSRSQKSLTVGRETLLHDAYEEIMSCGARDLRKMKIAISFRGEEGLDYGGPSREFYFFVSRELFNPYYGLFEYSSVGSYTVQISPHSMDILDALQWFRFAGRFIGMAVVQGYLVDVFFARHVYKALLGKPYSVEDLQVIDLEFFNSLKYVLENDPEPLALMFAIEEQSFGVITEHELMKGGNNIAVVEDNKKQYVELMVQYRLGKGTTKQTEAFVKGFKEMIPPSILSTFDPQELEWLIAGQAQVDVADWKENTIYWGYEEDSEVVRWFWMLVKEYSNEQRLRLLQFITGTSSIPLEGFKGLKGSDGTNQLFTIDMDYSDNGDDAFPRAHTCFNRLDIPVYSSYEVLKNKLTRAIEETEAFGNA